jgi:hypothetical protein
MFFILAFCSPITFYGAVYWEHTLDLLLLFSGIFFIICPTEKPWLAIILGLTSGLSVWLRPESLLLNILFIGVIALSNDKQRATVNWFFFLSMLAGAASFMAFNKVEYGTYFGRHGSQILANGNYNISLRDLRHKTRLLAFLLIEYFPVALLLIPVLYAWLKLKWPLDIRIKGLIFVVIIFCFCSPFIFPNAGGKQWGPRYFLPLIPILILIFADAYVKWKNFIRGTFKWALVFTIAAMAGVGFLLNTFIEARELRNENLNGVLPALNYVKRDPGKIVLVNSQFVTQELGDLFKGKSFFLAEDSGAFRKIIPLLKNQGENHFVYINEGGLPDGIANILSFYQVKLINKGRYRIGVFPLN